MNKPRSPEAQKANQSTYKAKMIAEGRELAYVWLTKEAMTKVSDVMKAHGRSKQDAINYLLNTVDIGEVLGNE